MGAGGGGSGLSQRAPTFREHLVTYLPHWVGEGLISQAQADAIAKHHGLHELKAAEPRSFASYVLVAGGVLLGLGLISFVAANWAAIPDWLRCLGAMILMVGFQVAGLRDLPKGDRQGRSQAFLLVGHLMVGATMGLLAQWFQVGGDGWGLFAGWAVAVGASAVALRHAPLGIMAAILWLTAFQNAPSELFTPFTASCLLLLVPLGLWLPSGFVFFLGASASVVGGLYLAGKGGVLAFCVAWVALCLGFWGHELLSQAARAGQRWRAFWAPEPLGGGQGLPGSAALGPLALLGLLQVQGWLDFWKEADRQPWEKLSGGDWALLAPMCLLGLLLWAQSGRTRPDARIHYGFFAFALWALALEAGRGALAPEWSTVLGNGGLALGSLGLAAVGLWRQQRAWFWLGFASFAVMVCSRFLEYTDGLMIKAAVFSAWGLILMVGGAWAEKRFHRAAEARATEGKAA